MFEGDRQSSFEQAFAAYSAAPTHVVLPREGALRSYRLDATGTHEVAVLQTVDDRGNFRPLRPGYSQMQRTVVSVCGDRALVVEQDIELLRQPMTMTAVTVCDLESGEPIFTLPSLKEMTRPGVLLVGDFVFVGGKGHRYWNLADPGQREWVELPIPADVQKRTIDFYGVSGRTIWAIDDIMAPLFAVAYPVDRRCEPAAHRITSLINGSIVGYAANDFGMAYLFAESTRSGLTKSCSVYSPLRHEFVVNLDAGIHGNDRDRYLGVLRDVAWAGTTLVGAFDGFGLREARLESVLRDRDTPIRPDWLAPVPTPDGRDVISLVSVPNTHRLYAIVGEESPTWFGYSSRKRSFVESP